MQTLRLLAVLLAACSTSTPTSKPTVASGSASAPASELDRGAFVLTARGKVVANETFAFTRKGANVVLHSKSVGASDPENHLTEGELELDAKHRPVRASYRVITPADAFTYKLGGTPLTLDVTRDDKREPQHLVATVAPDVYTAGPGLAPLAALCSLVTGDVVLNTIGDNRTAATHYLEAYRGAPVGALQRIIFDDADLDFELACDGPRLVAGGVADADFWFSRAGREADLAALKAAPRPEEHAWKHPVVESEPWDPLHTFLFPEASIIVTRDKRSRTNRLTVFSITDGKELAHRDFPVPLESHVMCEALPKTRLVCANDGTKFLKILDAKTLTDQTDLFPALAGVAKDLAVGSRKLRSAGWGIMYVDGKRLLIDQREDRPAVEIDLETGKAKEIPMPEDRFHLRPAGPTACPTTLSNPLVVGNSEWSIDQTGDSAKLVRKKTSGGAAQPPLDLAFDHPSLLRCKPKAGAAYIITHAADKSVLGLLAPDGKTLWKTELGAHPSDPHIVGGTMVLTMSDEARRVLGIDTATGKILWVATGPLPK